LRNSRTASSYAPSVQSGLFLVAQSLRRLGQRVVVARIVREVTVSDMPHSNTIERAISVTFSRSFAAPFVTRPKTTSSAARPARATTIRSTSSSFVWR
jgi:hypothetical protein